MSVVKMHLCKRNASHAYSISKSRVRVCGDGGGRGILIGDTIWASSKGKNGFVKGSALVNIRRKALGHLMIFTQGRTVFCFYITLK